MALPVRTGGHADFKQGMCHMIRVQIAGYAILLLALMAANTEPAEARRDIITPSGACFIILSSFHGTNPPKALRQAQGDLEYAIRRLSKQQGWKSTRVSPARVRPTPTLRSEVTPRRDAEVGRQDKPVANPMLGRRDLALCLHYRRHDVSALGRRCGMRCHFARPWALPAPIHL